MAWLLVIAAGGFETGFAVLLKESDGFKNVWPTVGFAICAILSFGLLTIALKELPVGSAYAIWTGLGAAGTAIIGMVIYGDAATALRLGSISCILAGVVGLSLAGSSVK